MFDWKLIFLGGLQGLTEFLPVSSSGHLALFQILFEYSESNMLGFDVALHLATLLATLCFFARDILRIASDWFCGLVSADARKREGWSYGWSVIAGTIITMVIALPLKKIVEFAMTSSLFVAGGLLITSLLLWLMDSARSSSKKITLKTGLITGVAQGIAALPGVSRSGSTIFAGVLSGLAPEHAFKFSFILSIPAILGATILEAYEMLKTGASLPEGWWGGAILAFVVGLLSLALLRKFVLGRHWKIFSVYCATIATIILGLNF